MTATGGFDVVVAGDALIDLTPATTARGSKAYEPHAGGSCLNVAIGLARMDVQTAFLARLSSDGWGQLLRAHLAASGVAPDYLVDADDVSTLAAVHLLEGQATYSFHSEGAADRGLMPEHLPELPLGAALHLGSIALVLEPVASTLEGLLEREAGRRLISLDPNIRPGLISDHDAYVERFASWLPSVDLLKLSEEDLLWLYPEHPQEDVFAAWHAAGVSLILLTQGGRGAQASTPSGTMTVAAPKVTVVDTVGAGDAFMSGALAHLHHRGELRRATLGSLDDRAVRELLDVACAVAADTCTRTGAEPPRRRFGPLGR